MSNTVIIKQFKNKAKAPVAGLTPEHAIYDSKGIRLDAKLGNVNLQEFRDLQNQGVNAINSAKDASLYAIGESNTEGARGSAITAIDTAKTTAVAAVESKKQEILSETNASLVSSNTTGLTGNNVQSDLNSIVSSLLPQRASLSSDNTFTGENTFTMQTNIEDTVYVGNNGELSVQNASDIKIRDTDGTLADYLAQKANKNGYYEGMAVGYSRNLIPSGNGTEQIIQARKSGGTNILDANSSANISVVKGYTLMWRQILDNTRLLDASYEYKFTNLGYASVTYENGVYALETPATANTCQFLKAITTNGHKCLWGASIKSGQANKIFVRSNNDSYTLLTTGTEYTLFANILTSRDVHELNFVCSQYSETTFGDTFYVKNIFFIDLDITFGTTIADTITTADDVAKLLGYPSWNAYSSSTQFATDMAYSATTIIKNGKYNGIRSIGTDADGKSFDTTNSSIEAIRKQYFPDGMNGINIGTASEVCDTIEAGQVVRRVGVVKLNDLNWYQTGSYKFFSANAPSDLKVPSSNWVAAKLYTNLDLRPMSSGGAENTNKSIGVTYTGSIRLRDEQYQNVEAFKESLTDKDVLYYELSDLSQQTTPITELNLSYPVSNSNDAKEIAVSDTNSTPLVADIRYGLDYPKTIEANKSNIGNLASLSTTSKTDLVSAINEIVQRLNNL